MCVLSLHLSQLKWIQEMLGCGNRILKLNINSFMIKRQPFVSSEYQKNIN